jgi:hypothetical protein
MVLVVHKLTVRRADISPNKLPTTTALAIKRSLGREWCVLTRGDAVHQIILSPYVRRLCKFIM